MTTTRALVTEAMVERAAKAILSTKQLGHYFPETLFPWNSGLILTITRAALEAALSAPSGDGVPGMVLVPKTALDWLFGEGQDSEGRWFYEFPEGVEPPTEQYWWRTPFRKMLASRSALSQRGTDK